MKFREFLIGEVQRISEGSLQKVQNCGKKMLGPFDEEDLVWIYLKKIEPIPLIQIEKISYLRIFLTNNYQNSW